jgi:hypothetical protein
VRRAALRLSWALALGFPGAAQDRPGPGQDPQPYLVTLGLDAGDQRPVAGILRFWSTPLDGATAPPPLAFTRVFSFAEPLETYLERPADLQEAVVRRAFPGLSAPFAPGGDEPPDAAGVRLEGARVTSWSFRVVNGVPGALESVEISFATRGPWFPFQLRWPGY